MESATLSLGLCVIIFISIIKAINSTLKCQGSHSCLFFFIDKCINYWKLDWCVPCSTLPRSLSSAIDPGITISPCIALTTEERSNIFSRRCLAKKCTQVQLTRGKIISILLQPFHAPKIKSEVPYSLLQWPHQH